jgi:SAM-dependent methyltransferase
MMPALPDSPRQKYPAVLDFTDLALVHVAKLGRQKNGGTTPFYDSFFTDDDVRKYFGDVRHRWRYGTMRRLFDKLFPHGRASVVDVGCGLGISLDHLPSSVDFVGVEFSRETVALARSIHPDRSAAFREGGFPNLPLEDGTCDFCIFLEVLEHLVDDRQALDELARIVRPGGYLLISVPAVFYWRSYRRLIGHLRHYDATNLYRMLSDHHFAIVERVPQFTRFWQSYHCLYVLFRLYEAIARRFVRAEYSVYETRVYQRLSTLILTELGKRSANDGSRSTFLLCCRETGGRAC